MKRIALLTVLLVGFVLGFSSTASASPWTELGDAATLPGSAQEVIGVGPLDSISGSFVENDVVDMYKIYIRASNVFYADVIQTGGSSPWSHQLFLFDSNGVGILGNDNINGGAYLPTFNSPGPGIYYLAISQYNIDPGSEEGAIFPGTGQLVWAVNDSPVVGWGGTYSPRHASYTVRLSGVEFICQPDGASCDDNNVCNGIETCDPILNCQAGTPLDCDDQNLCTTDSCDPLTGCANVPVECPAGEQCDPEDGECKVPPECTVDAECDDGFFCNGAETCDAGICQPGTPPDCDDGVVCTVDTCDEVNDICVNTPDDAFCDDADVCNGIETCDPILDCQAGTALDCDDQNLCTTDSCDPVAGCVFTPVECPAGEQCDPADGLCKMPPECTVDTDCDDGMFCNGAETCDAGICQPGTPPDCDDGVVCTVDTCDEVNDASTDCSVPVRRSVILLPGA
jgi:hypothetical protein